MTQVLSDVRFAVRLMGRNPGFFIILIGIIAGGIGATTAIFSVVESLLLQPLPYSRSEELVTLRSTAPWSPSGPLSLPDFLDLQEQATTFESMGASRYYSFGLANNGQLPERFEAANVSGNFFRVLGIRALQGRLLSPEDDRPDAPRVAVISAPLWRQRFAADLGTIGRAVTLSGRSYTIVGVAPEGFRFARLNRDRTDIWTPLAVTLPNYAQACVSDRGNHFLHVIGRLKPTVELDRAQQQVAAIAAGIALAHPDANTNLSVSVMGLHDYLVKSSRSGTLALFGSVLLAFIVVCANVATLLLTRGHARRGEMAIRAALGASPRRLTQQVLTETVLVFAIGSLGGGLLANYLVNHLGSNIVQTGVASTIDIRVDGVGLAFGIGCCCLCGVLSGLVPALSAARVDPQLVLKELSLHGGMNRAHRVVGGAFVVLQVALAATLLAASGLGLEALARVVASPPGFEATNLATARLTISDARYPDRDHAIAFYQSVIERVAALPGVESVAATSSLPMQLSGGYDFQIEGQPPHPPNEGPTLALHSITQGYFRTMRIPVLRGRSFSEADRRDQRPVVIISRRAAEQLFSGQDPLGHRIDWGFNDGEWRHVWREIVGVAGDVQSAGLAHPAEADGYIPLEQDPDTRALSLVIKSPREAWVLRQLPELTAAMDAEQDVAELATMSERLDDTFKNRRSTTGLLVAFGVAALVLATLGLFGLVSYTTALRTREFGIRLALGSTPKGVVWLVLRDAVRLLASGLVIGLLGAIFAGRVLASRVPGLNAFEPLVYAFIPIILGSSGLLACLVPAWRACRIPPANALRYT